MSFEAQGREGGQGAGLPETPVEAGEEGDGTASFGERRGKGLEPPGAKC